MTSVSELSGGWFAFLDERLQVTAVVAAATADNDPNDALRGLYISDEQALSLAGDLGSPKADQLLATAVERLGLDALDAAVLTVCSAPELHPRYGRLFAYLQDDVTRKLPSPRLVASLLTGDGVDPADVLTCFTPDASMLRVGAIRLLTPDAATALADRPIKLADRLAAFLLGANRLADTAAGVQLRRVTPDPAAGRVDVVAEVALLLGAETRLPLVVCGPDAAAVVADRRRRRPCVLLGVRELDRPDALADARLAAALERSLLCLDGLDDLTPVERSRLLRSIDESPERMILVGGSRREALALSDRTALVIEVPFPSFAERRHAWEALTGHDRPPRRRREVPSLDRADRRGGRGQRDRGTERAARPSRCHPTSILAPDTRRRPVSESSQRASTRATASTTSCYRIANSTC